MTFRPIPINAPLWANVDEKELSDFSAELHDVYRDDLGKTVRRPGLKEFVQMPAGGSIDGIMDWEENDLAHIVSGGNLYTVSKTGVISLVQANIFETGKRATWAPSLFPTPKLYAANGGKIVEFDGATAAQLTDVDAPTAVSHVAVFDTYLLANEIGTSRFHHSDVGVPEFWSANFFSAESKPDKLQALLTGWNEIQLPGSKTIEPWYNDGATPFVPYKGAVIEFGTPAPHSTLILDNSLFFLNQERRLMRLNQRQPQVLSVPVDRIISGLTKVDDATLDNVVVGGRTFVVLTFPTDGKTLVYDYARNQWMGFWSHWNNVQAKYERFRGNVVHYMPAWNKHLVGDYTNGKIYEFDFDTYQDAGQEMRSAWLTGRIDHGTGLAKRSMELKIRVKRGHGASSADEPVLMLRWRDDGSDKWENTRNIGLGKMGENEMYVSEFVLGQYRSRQYEFSITGNVPLSLISVEEDVELVE